MRPIINRTATASTTQITAIETIAAAASAYLGHHDRLRLRARVTDSIRGMLDASQMGILDFEQ